MSKKSQGYELLNFNVDDTYGTFRNAYRDMDKKLLTIKIINRSKPLRNKVLVWFYQMARGIKEILSYAKKGIKELEKIEKREKYKQITFRL